VWEGNPDWRPGEDSYLAAPVQELVDKRGLALIARAPALFTEADRAFAAGDPFAAAAALDKLAGLGAPHPVVIEAQHKMREARRRATQLCELARERFQAGRLQAATDLAGRVVKAFPKLPPAQSIATELSAPEPSAALKRERKAMDLLMSVVPFLERGSVKPAARQLAPLNKDQLDPQARLLAQTLDGLFAEEAPKESVAPRALAIVRAYPDLDRVEELLRTGGEDPARELLSRCEPILAKTPLAPRLAQLKEKLSSKG